MKNFTNKEQIRQKRAKAHTAAFAFCSLLCKYMIFLLIFISFSASAQIFTASATYSVMHIPTDRGFQSLTTGAGKSNCPGTLVVTIPEAAVIIGVDVTYNFTSIGSGRKSYQRSQLRCVSPGGINEPVLYAGTGTTSGTIVYTRNNLNIANNVMCGGDIVFELHAGRTQNGTVNTCNTTWHRIDNNTWTVTVRYMIPDADSQISNSIEPDNDSISAAFISNGDRMDVFDVKITDLGTFDGIPTIINELVFTQGVGNEFGDWTQFIGGASLYGPDLGEDSGLEIYGYIESDRIRFTGTNIISVANYESEIYYLRIWIMPGLLSIHDNKKFQFELGSLSIVHPICQHTSTVGDYVCESDLVALYFPRDENSSITEGDAVEPYGLPVENASFGTRIDVLDFKLTDMGTGDGAHTIIDKITVRQGSSNQIPDWRLVLDGATLYGPDLGDGAGFEAFGIIDSGAIRFSASDIIVVEDGTSETYTLRLWLNPDMLTVFDNKILEVEIDYTDIETSYKFSSVFGIGNVNSGGMILFPKEYQTELAIGDSIFPATISSESNSFAIRSDVFNFTIKDAGTDGFNTIVDSLSIIPALLNEINDWSTVIAGATLFGPDLGETSGAEIIGVVGADYISFASQGMITVEDSTFEQYTLKIWLTDSLTDCKILSFKIAEENVLIDSSGSRFKDIEASSQNIKIEFVKTNEITILDGDAAVPSSVSSTATTYADRVNIMEFKITDTGTDRFNAIIDTIKITQGANNRIDDWTKAIEGASIFGPDLGELGGLELTGTVLANRIEFSEAAMINVLEGDTEIYTLRIWLKNDLSAINDNDSLDFTINYANVSPSRCNSSWMDTSSVSSGAVTINIEAIKLAFYPHQPPLHIEAGVPFTTTVIAVDGNNNFDADAAFDFSVELSHGTGILSSVTGLSQTLVNGTYTWANYLYNTPEKIILRAFSLHLNEGFSDTIICVDEYAELIELAGTEPDTICSYRDADSLRTMVFKFDLSDHGIADGLPTLINEIVIRQGDANEVADWTHAIAGATLYGPDLGQFAGTELVGTVDSNKISFSDLAFISIADGTTETYTLKIWLNKDLSNISHNDKLAFSLHYLDIAVANSGSTIFGDGFAQTDGIGIFVKTTRLIFQTNEPPAIVGYGNDFTVTVIAADENLNINTTDTSTVLLSKYSGSGTLQSDTGLTKKLVNGTFTWLDVTYNNLGFFVIQASAPGLNTAISDSIESVIDENSEISCGPALEQKKFSSTYNTYTKRQIVFDITFSDKGTSDGLPTLVNSVVFRQGIGNEIIDWTRAIQGATLFGPDLGEVTGLELNGMVDSISITFSGYQIIKVADGKSETYQLRIYLYEDLAGIIDNDSIDISLSYADITTPVLGTSYVGIGDISSGGVAVDIKAIKLQFVKNQPPTIVGFSYNFVVAVQAVDANGNLDKDATDLVTLALYQGNGVLASPPPYYFTQVLTAGTYTWYEAKYNKDEPFRLRVVSNTLSQGLSDVIYCKKCVRSALYPYHIDSDKDFTSLPGSSSCPGVMSIFVPSFAIVTSVDVFYTFDTHATPGMKAHQRSQLRCVSPGGTSEPYLYEGSGSQGAQEYVRLNLDIANAVQPGTDYVFELHAGRTTKGNGCGHSFNKVNEYTWTVCVNYIILGVHWTGEVSTDWHNPYNWACEIVPTRYLDVYILADAPRMPVIYNDNGECRSLNIENGSSVTVAAGKALDVYGDLTVNGVLDVRTNYTQVAFRGNGSTANGRQLVSGDGNLEFHHMLISSGAYVKLLKDISVTGDLSVRGTIEATLNRPIYMIGESNNFLVESGGKFIPKLSTVFFTGKERQKIRGGTTPLHNLVVNTTERHHQLVLLDDVTVNNKVYLNKGSINLNKRTLTINNASPDAIHKGSTDIGYINAEIENNQDFASKIKWNVASSIGTYTIPFGKDTNKIFPLSLDLAVNRMGSNGYLLFSTYGTGSDNMPKPDNVNHLGDTVGGFAPLDFIADRYWYIDYHVINDKQDAKSSIEGYITFSYLGEELDNVVESSMMAQRYNTEIDVWADMLYTQNDFEELSAHGFSVNTPIEFDGKMGKYQTSYIDTAQFFNVWILSNVDMPLPIKLLYFKAECNNSAVDLSWTTATETNNHFFTIQKSHDGNYWENLAVVQGAGNSSTEKHYNYSDDSNPGLLTYYRLKQTDFNGDSETFVPTAANCGLNEANQVMVFPNPVSGNLSITFFNTDADNIQVELTDVLGKRIYASTIDNAYATGSHTLNMEKLSDGVYFLKFTADDYTYTEKIVKRQ